MDKNNHKKEKGKFIRALTRWCKYKSMHTAYFVIRALLLLAASIAIILLISIPLGAEIISAIKALSTENLQNNIIEFIRSTVVLTAVCSIVALCSSKLVKIVFPRKGKERSADYLIEHLTSGDRRSPATSIKQLAERISGKDASPEILKEVRSNLAKTIMPIENFILNNEKILVVSGKWGSGKTTSTIVAVSEVRKDGSFAATSYRFIYESAFKYVSGFSEFKKDILDTVQMILSEQNILAPSPMREILNNISPSSFHIPLIRLSSFTTTTDYIEKLNRKYRKKKGNSQIDPFKIIIIIDDIDRLQSEELIQALAFLSILRRLEFIKIIIPIDRDAVVAQIAAAKINEPNVYIKKYLPEQSEIEIKSDFDLFKNIYTKKIRKDFDEELSDEQVQPILELICIKVFANKLAENMKHTHTSSLNGWPNLNADFPQELTEKNDYNSEYILKARDTLYKHLSANDNGKVRHYTGTTEGFEAVLYKLAYNGKREPNKNGYNPLRVDDYLYKNCYANWILAYASDNWGRVGATMREIDDIYNALIIETKKEKIDSNLEPHKIFVRTYNALFPRWPILDENWER